MSHPPAPPRRRTRTILAFGLVAAVAVVPAARAQSQNSSLETTLLQFNEATVRGYIQPLADLFAANMGSGFYHGASIPAGRMRFSLELVAMGSKVEDSHRVYTANTPEGFQQETFETATVFGGQGTTVTDPSGAEYRGSDGFIDADYLPSAAPQLRVSFLRTEATVRYLSSDLFSSLPEEDFPETTLIGLGLRHDIGQYLPMLPFGLSVGGFYSSVEMEDMVTFTGLSVGVQASKTFSPLTLYGGLASESGTMNLSYTPADPSQTPVDLDIDSESGVRITGGAALRLGPIELFGDASFGSFTAYSGGLRIGF